MNAITPLSDRLRVTIPMGPLVINRRSVRRWLACDVPPGTDEAEAVRVCRRAGVVVRADQPWTVPFVEPAELFAAAG